MKKYKVTEKHPGLKEGVEIRLSLDGNYEIFDATSGECFGYLDLSDINTQKGKMWIEEILEPVYDSVWIEKMKLIDDVLELYRLEDIETLKKILERA